MTGSIQHKKGRLYMVIHYKDANGKSKNKWISTGLSEKGNIKAAKLMLEQWLREHSDCDINYNDMLLSDYLQRWLVSVQIDLQPSTYKGYSGNLKNHIIPYFKKAGIKLVDLKIRDLEWFYSQHLLNEKKLSPQSIRHCHRIISKALNDAMRQEVIASNPSSLAKCPKVPKFIATYLNMSQLQKLMELIEGCEIEHIVKLISVYGLRRSEALGLCWDKVDFDKNQFTICRAMIQGSKNYLKNCTKNESSYRTLPLTADMRDMLLMLKQRQEEHKRMCGDSYQESNLVFVWPDGSPITPNYVTRKFHNLIKNSDLPHVRLHDLRHSTASNLLSKGFSLVDIQLWLGHSQPSTTLNYYSHVDSSSKKNIQMFLEKELTLRE